MATSVSTPFALSSISASAPRTRSTGASYRWLDVNQRLHAQHGPIDLIIQIDALPAEQVLAFKQAIEFIDKVLHELVAELPGLRRPADQLVDQPFVSAVAQHMLNTVSVFSPEFITPMASVAGAVADATLNALKRNRTLTRASVNNGGDIALYLSPTAGYNIGLIESPVTGTQVGFATIDSSSSVRGVASSGWQGRSHSMGIADVVTVLATDAATADAAATLIANKVDLPNSEHIERQPACELAPDSDLVNRPVTVDVPILTTDEKRRALSSGQAYAQTLYNAGVIDSAFLCLQNEHRTVGTTDHIAWRQTA